MSTEIAGIAFTAFVGVAGILSTHLLARGQRRAEAARASEARRERYEFARHEAESQLVAELVAELRTTLVSARLRLSVTATYRRHYLVGLADEARADADRASDATFAEQLRSFAERLDADPSWAAAFARTREAGLPPSIDTVSTVRRLSELTARLQVVAGNEVARAAEHAQAAATMALLRLEAEDLADFKNEVDLGPFDEAIGALINAAIYELRLRPHGEETSLDTLVAAYRGESGETFGPGERRRE